LARSPFRLYSLQNQKQSKATQHELVQVTHNKQMQSDSAKAAPLVWALCIYEVFMNCFNHPDAPAIGTCKACSRGLCLDCSSDLGHGLACKNSHENRVIDLEMIISKNVKAYADASKNIYLLPAFFLFMGLLFSGYSLYRDRGFTDLSFIMGLGFVFFGIVFFLRNRKIFSNNA
jgi:hypothetical protein